MYVERENRNTADQLLRAVGAISSNLAEGYGCGSGPERARYYGYALTSTRESIDWYFKARDTLGAAVVEQRVVVLDRIIRILTVIIPESVCAACAAVADQPTIPMANQPTMVIPAVRSSGSWPCVAAAAGGTSS